jgi:hypothetical protein
LRLLVVNEVHLGVRLLMLCSRHYELAILQVNDVEKRMRSRSERQEGDEREVRDLREAKIYQGRRRSK